jgi:hypothetical protein
MRRISEPEAALVKVIANVGRPINEVWADLPAAELRQFSKFADKLGDRLESYLGK